LKMQQGEVTLEAMRSGELNPVTGKPRATGTRGSGTSGAGDSFTKGREGFIASSLRNMGIDNSELYDGEGQLTTRAREVLDTIDVLAQANPDADMNELFQAASQQVGMKTSSAVKLEEEKRLLDSSDKEEKKRGQELKRVRLQEEKVAKKAGVPEAPAETPEQRTVMVKSIISGLSHSDNQERNEALSMARERFERGELEPLEMASIHKALEESSEPGAMKGWEKKKADPREVLKVLKVHKWADNVDILNSKAIVYTRHVMVKRIQQGLGVSKPQAEKMLAGAEDTVSRSQHLGDLFKMQGKSADRISQHEAKQQKIRDAAAKAGLNPDEL